MTEREIINSIIASAERGEMITSFVCSLDVARSVANSIHIETTLGCGIGYDLDNDQFGYPEFGLFWFEVWDDEIPF